MDVFLLICHLVVVLACIVMGTRSSGVGLGVWGGIGVAVLVLGFQLQPGSPPVDALLIVLAVVVAASLMQVAGGIDWMVSIAAKLIARAPRQITLVAPLVTFLFTVGAGTANILYPLLPVIQDLAYRNGVRPSRPLSLSVVSSGIALGCSPVAAAMAAMITLTEPKGFGLVDIIKVTLPAAVVAIVLSSFIVSRLGKDIADDPEIQARIESGAIPSPGAGEAVKVGVNATWRGMAAAIIFLVGVVAIVVFGLFEQLRPHFGGTALAMTPLIEMLMLAVGVLIVLICRPKVGDVPASTVFRAGTVSAIALFGLAWLTDTFLQAHAAAIEASVGGLVSDAPWIFALGVFVVCVLTTSQSTATRTIVPIGLSAGVPLGVLSGMWAGAFAGIYLLPTNGSQIAAANFDTSGSTRLGTKLLDHSFALPTLILGVIAIAFGALFGWLWG